MQLIDNLKAAKAAGVQVKSFSMTETHRGVAWSCTVYLNGKKLGMVDNSGNGGATHIAFNVELQQQIMSLLKQHDYKLQLNLGDYVITEPTDLESWLSITLSQMGDEQARLRTYKKKAKLGVIFEQTTAPQIAMQTGEDSPRLREFIKTHCGDAFVAFLNDELAAL